MLYLLFQLKNNKSGENEKKINVVTFFSVDDCALVMWKRKFLQALSAEFW
jgi:hypothetical protein